MAILNLFSIRETSRFKRGVNRSADRRNLALKSSRIVDFGDKSSGFADLKNTVDRRSAESFGPVSEFCQSRSSFVDRMINFLSALVNVLLFCRLTFHFRGFRKGLSRDPTHIHVF